MMMYGGFDMVFSIIFPILFLLVVGMIGINVVKGISTWNKNNHSPRLTVPAVVTSKRQNTSFHSHPNAGDASGAHGFHSTADTVYYVTFQVESGDRMELTVTGREYGMIAVGDEGKLTFQGTRYLEFEREN